MILNVNLSPDGVKEAIDSLERYKRRLLQKAELFINLLAEEGIEVVNSNMGTAGDSNPDHNVKATINSTGNAVQGVLSVSGKDLLFIEFGAGIHYNGSAGTSPNPKGQEFGYVIGSYGLGHGKEDSWIYRDEETGKWRKSYGTQAGMPVYKASVQMRKVLHSVAARAFGR